MRITIGPTPRWTGHANVPEWPCVMCGHSFETGGALRSHLGHSHPTVEIIAETNIEGSGYQEALAYVESLNPAATAGWRSV